MHKIERELEATRDAVRNVRELLSRIPEHSGLDETRPLLDALSSLLPPQRFSSQQQPTSADVAAFERWFLAQGGTLRGVRPCAGLAEGTGIVAAAAVSAGAATVTVPWALMLTEATAQRSAAHGALGPAAASFPEVAVALQLLAEKHSLPESRFAPYIRALPRRISTPLFWSHAEFCALRGSPTLAECLAAVRAAASQFCHLFLSLDNGAIPRFMPLRAFTYAEYAWALSVLMTRKNRVPRSFGGDGGSGGNDMVALIPMWDMHNHTVHGEVTTFASETDGCVCNALHDAGPGEQMFIHYGDRPNMQLFSHNGFVIEGNPHDIFLVLGPKQERSYALFVTATGEPSPALAELAQKEGTTVAELCRAMLAAYPTTIQQDRELLASEAGKALSSVERCAVALRVLEKRAYSKAAGIDSIPGDDPSVPLLPPVASASSASAAAAAAASLIMEEEKAKPKKKAEGGKKKKAQQGKKKK